MELLLADKLGYPKGFNGFEWSSLPADGVKKSQMPSYLVEDLPNTDGFSIRQKFKEVSFAEAPKIDFFKPFIKSNYEIFRKDQQKKQKLKQLRQMKKDEKYMRNLTKREELKQKSVDLQKSMNQDTGYMSQNQQSENVLDKFISLTPTIQSKTNNPILSMIKGKIIQERKEKKEKEKKKQQLIDDLHYYKIFADKYSRLTIECVDNISKLIGDDEGSQATDSDQKIDELRDSQILRDKLQRSEQKLNTLQERGSYLSQIQQKQLQNQLEDIIESKEQQYKVNIDNSHSQNKVNMIKQDIMVSRTSQIPYSQNNNNNNKSKSFLEVEISENKIRDNGNVRSRNSTLSQMPQNQEVKSYSSTMYGNQNQQQKRVSLINQLQNQQNRLDESLNNFFKGDGILYKTFLRNKSQSKSHKNNSSFLQSTANTNLNFTNKTPSSKQNQLTASYNNASKNNRSISSDIQLNVNLSKTPKQFSKTQNNFNNRFLTPQKTKQIDKYNYNSLAAQSTNYENRQEAKQINKNYHFLNQYSLNNTMGFKKDSNQSKTPKEQSSFLSTKNRYLTPDKKSLVDKSNILNTSNYQDITIRKSINYDFDDQQSCYTSLKQNPNKQMKNNYINSSKNVGNAQDKYQRNQESPTFTEYSLHSEYKKSILLNNIRSKRESQIQNDRNNMSYIDPEFQEKSDVHHRSVMYAMKTLKNKFGLNKEKVQNKSSKLD
ncbi:hypothetical protein ABPG72_002779 [Tetrahymena utriculariae]